jgi:hypothetical protein
MGLRTPEKGVRPPFDSLSRQLNYEEIGTALAGSITLSSKLFVIRALMCHMPWQMSLPEYS